MEGFRYALGGYLKKDHPEEEVYKDEEFVVIHDKFPKSAIHWLVLPRDKSRNLSDTPIKTLRADPEFYDKCSEIVTKMLDKAGDEFGRLVGIDTATATSFIQAGMHAKPSMAHMHIHIKSPDMFSPKMKRAVHYTSFTTDFFVNFWDIPELSEQSDQLDMHKMEKLIKTHDLICWRCHKNFDRSFKKLKEHLEWEFHRVGGWKN